MATYKETSKHLSELPIGTYRLIDIVNQIKSISSTKHTTKLLLAQQSVSPEYRAKCKGPLLVDVYVDISYQRSLKLKKIYDHLDLKDVDENEVGFEELLAGYVDFATRPDGKTYVWDGFRRCILALLKGIDQIPSNDIVHPKGWSNKRCQQKEAWAFTEKNSKMEAMKKEELFKAGIAQKKKFYMEIKEIMENCDLDVLGVNPGKRNLGGYVEFEKLAVTKPFSEGVTQSSDFFLEEASKMIQKAWPTEEVSGFMLAGMAHYLHANEVDGENGAEYYIPKGERERLLDLFVNPDTKDVKGGTQSSCTKNRLHSCPRESVAWRICRLIMGMSVINASKFIGLDDEESEMLNVSGK